MRSTERSTSRSKGAQKGPGPELLPSSVSAELESVFEKAPFLRVHDHGLSSSRYDRSKALVLVPTVQKRSKRMLHFAPLLTASLTGAAAMLIFVKTAWSEPSRTGAIVQDIPGLALPMQAPPVLPTAARQRPIVAETQLPLTAERPRLTKISVVTPMRSHSHIVRASHSLRLAATRGHDGCGDRRTGKGWHCQRDEELAADLRLRDAYAAATSAGVERATLVSYHRRWWTLRDHARDQPHDLIRGYDALADRLNALSRQAQAPRDVD